MSVHEASMCLLCNNSVLALQTCLVLRSMAEIGHKAKHEASFDFLGQRLLELLQLFIWPMLSR